MMSESELDDRHWHRVLEAVLFASSEPIAEKALAERLPEGVALAPILEDLRQCYEGRGVNLSKAGSSWSFRTAADLAGHLNEEREVDRKLSRAAIETLAVIAYHQPVSRGEIEEIRGVAVSKGTLDLLLEAGWIRPRGRRRTPGRPMTWGTSDVFLDHFDLTAIDDLPGLAELKAAGLLETGPALSVYADSGAMGPVDDVEADVLEGAAIDELRPDPLEEEEGTDDEASNVWSEERD